MRKYIAAAIPFALMLVWASTALAGGGTVIFNTGGCYLKQVDPVVQYGVPTSAHMHAICGVEGINENSTGASIRASNKTATAVLPKSVRTVWWMPAIQTSLGQFVAPTSSKLYYTNGCNPNDPAKPCPPPLDTRNPNDLAYVFGDKANQTYNGAIGLWRCSGAPTTTQKRNIPTNCTAYGNKGVQLAIYGPTCWDGVNMGPGLGRTGSGPADGRTHVRGSVCSPENPVRIMGSVWSANFPASAIGGKLSCDTSLANAGYCLHTDHVDEGLPNSQGQDGLQRICDLCMNADRTATANAVTCTVSGTGIVKRVSDNLFVTD